MALQWRFQLDPQNVGLKEKWHEKTWEQTKNWNSIRTDNFWENPYKAEKYMPEKLLRILKQYDGIGWYSTTMKIPEDWTNRDVFLYFGAVDESCWIYVNGKLVGTHLFKNRNDWNTPFAICINSAIDPDKEKQTITVRVEDKSGAGGIWKRVWLVSKNKKSIK